MAVYTVTQITTYLKGSLDRDAFLNDLWVNGEVSNLSRSSAGNLYFTVKDADSQLRCVMFRSESGGGDMVTNGGAVIVHGRLSLYPARGEVQVYVDLVQPEGTGELYLELERLKLQLEEEGLFDPTRKRPLPVFPSKVGIVTSPTGSVFHDICNVIERRYPLTEVVLSPTLVQGDRAAAEIVAAIRALNDLGGIDVIIVARGGGSLEELWPFNEEAVVRAIYTSRVPIISGVGHETDTTISDMVADLRAPTPSAAAEIAVPDATRLQGQVALLQRDAFNTMTQQTAHHRQGLEIAVQRLRTASPQVEAWQQRVDELTQSLARGLTTSLILARERFAGMELRLTSLDPQAVLQRGYAVIQRTSDGSLVTSTTQVQSDEELNVTVHDGSFDVRAV